MDSLRAGLVIYHPSDWAILLIRDARTSMWSFPKGRIEPYDRDLVDAAVRETYEETGFVLDKHYLLLTRMFETHGNTNLLYAEAKTPTLPFSSCVEQHVAEVAWVAVRDIKSIHCNFPLRAWRSRQQ